MAVIVKVTIPGVTPQQYDELRAKCGWLDEPPVGGIAHAAWFDGGDLHGLDAWEDEAAFAAFGEQRLGPAMAAVGIDAQPQAEFLPAHEVFLPVARTITA